MAVANCCFPQCCAPELKGRDCMLKNRCGGKLHHMCFTSFCDKYSIPDPPGDGALCWECCKKIHHDACEEEELSLLESAAAGSKNASKDAQLDDSTGSVAVVDVSASVTALEKGVAPPSSSLHNGKAVGEAMVGCTISPLAPASAQLEESGAPLQNSTGSVDHVDASASAAVSVKRGGSSSPLRNGEMVSVEAMVGCTTPPLASALAMIQESGAQLNKITGSSVAASVVVSENGSPPSSPLRNGEAVNEAIDGCATPPLALPPAHLKDSGAQLENSTGCVEAVAAAAACVEPTMSEALFPKAGTRIEVDGRTGFVFSSSEKALPERYIVGIAYDGDPVSWERQDFVAQPRPKWSLLVDEEVTEHSVHYVLRASSGYRLPEGYLMGPSAINVLCGDGEVVTPKTCGWMLFAGHSPAIQSLNGMVVAAPTSKIMSAFRMGDHVYYNDVVPVALNGLETVDHIPIDGSAIFFGVALAKEPNAFRRYVLLMALQSDEMFLAPLDCIRPGLHELRMEVLRSSLAEQQRTITFVIQKKLLRSPTAVSSAFDRAKKGRAAGLACNEEEMRVSAVTAMQ